MVAVHRRFGKNKEEKKKRRFARCSSRVILHDLDVWDLTVTMRLPYAISPAARVLRMRLSRDGRSTPAPAIDRKEILNLNDLFLNGVLDEIAAIVQIEFLHQAGAMGLHGLD